MTKKQRLAVKKSITSGEDIRSSTELIFKKLSFNPLIKACGLFIILIFSIFNNDRIVKLTALTSNAIFSSEKVLGHITYYTILIFTIIICLAVFLGTWLAKSRVDFSSLLVLKKSYSFYLTYDILSFVLVTFNCLFFFIIILLTPCNISGSSMSPTFEDGDRVLLWSFAYNPKREDVVVFDSRRYSNDPNASSSFYIKRIVGASGDKLTYLQKDSSSGILYLNDVNLQAISYLEYRIIFGSIGAVGKVSVTIPEGRLLVFGDNREVSHDSRDIGLIYEKDVIGKVFLRFYPLNKIGYPTRDNLIRSSL